MSYESQYANTIYLRSGSGSFGAGNFGVGCLDAGCFGVGSLIARKFRCKH